MQMKKRLFVSATVAALLSGAAYPGLAQTAYPERPVKLVIPFAAGGATDVLGRLLALSMQEKLGQSVVVENKPGAGTVLAASQVAKAPADGYTLLAASSGPVSISPLFTKTPYDSEKDFSPIAMLGLSPYLLVTNPDFPAKDAREFLRALFRTAIAANDKSRGGVFDPVTEADRASEAAMRQLIKRQFPAHGVVGEEYGAENDDAEFCWVLDPIDGTKAFISGLPVWGTLIGLLQNGRPVLGMMNQPFTRERFWGDGGQARWRGPTRRGPCRSRPSCNRSAPSAGKNCFDYS